MKKIFLLAAAFMLMLSVSLTASASPSCWKHPEYDFSRINTINITQVEIKDANYSNFTAEENTGDVVKMAVYTASGKHNILVTENAAAAYAAPEEKSFLKKDKKAPKNVDLKITVNLLGYVSEIVPAHYEHKTEYITQDVKDKYGKKTSEIRIPITNKVWVPEQTKYTAHLDLMYNVLDAETGVMIFNSHDKRYRASEFDTSGMLERSTKDFVKNLTKK